MSLSKHAINPFLSLLFPRERETRIAVLGRSHVLGERAVAARSFSTDTPLGPRLGVDDKPESAGASPNLVRRPGVSSSASPKGRGIHGPGHRTHRRQSWRNSSRSADPVCRVRRDRHGHGGGRLFFAAPSYFAR